MNRLMNPLSHFRSVPQSVMREIAPGVWLEVKPVPNRIKPANVTMREKLQNAMLLFRRQSSAVDLDAYLSRVERKAA